MKNQRGLTLIELIVVIAILSFVGLMAAPRFSHVLDDARLKAEANKMAWVLKTARQEAINSGHSKTVYFYPQSTLYSVRDGDTYWFEPGISYAGVTSFNVPKNEKKPACIFAPTGIPSSAGTAALKNRQGDVLFIIVSACAGRVRVSTQPPKSWE